MDRQPDELERQLRLLRGPRPTLTLDRPATLGDGIRRLDVRDLGPLEAAHEAARAAGRVSTFVPASGAATRLCQDLVAAWASEEPVNSREVHDVLAWATALAVWPELAAHGASAGSPRSVLGALVGADGIALQHRPKALVPFHRDGHGTRSAFHEHLVEACRLARDATGLVRAHFTVAADHLADFEAELAAVRPGLEAAHDARLDVGFSVQDPATDTVAVDADGALVRDADGAPLRRPGGHGALLPNLAALAGDVVLIKNVDNVAPEERAWDNLAWRRRLSGLLARLQGEAHALVRALRRGDAVGGARAFLARELGLDAPDDPAALAERLDRPWRVAGMVRDEGHPGGGPFWAASPDGVTLQIVEDAQIGSAPEQRAIAARATHFNPVDLALGLRDADGRPHDLARFVDPDAVLVSEKRHEGHPIRALEHPGLWNGGMARWNTVFVEIPATTFQPVKTLRDLLRVGHGGPLP